MGRFGFSHSNNMKLSVLVGRKSDGLISRSMIVVVVRGCGLGFDVQLSHQSDINRKRASLVAQLS